MKILLVCQSYFPEQFKITDIAETLVQEGNDVTVLTGLPNYPQGKIYTGYRWFKNRKQRINGVNIERAWLIERGKSKVQLFMNYVSFCISASFKALFDKNDYDIVLCYQLSPITMAVPAAIIKARKKIPFILYCLDLWPESIMAGGVNKNSKIFNMAKIISKRIYNQADKIIVTSPLFIEYFHQELGIYKNNECLYNYAEDMFRPKEYKCSTDGMDLLFAGNIGHMQSVETIIKAAELLSSNKNIIFHIVGDGSEKDTLKKYAKDKELSNIKFYGQRSLEEMPEFYNKADAMLITLKDNDIVSYTIPNKMQSYMAVRKPVIGSINGAVNRLINEANCGYCVQAEDPVGLANIIVEFYELSYAKKKILADNSLDFYEKNFKKTLFMKRLNKFMEKEVNEHV